MKNTIEEQAYQQYLNKTPSDILKNLQSTIQGLTPSEATNKLYKYGPNLLQAKQVKWTDIFIRQFISPFIYLLIAAALLSFTLGEFIDGAMILLFVCINCGLGFFQEYRSEQALKVLKGYTTATAKVRRGNHEQTIPVDEVVVGDIVLLQPGDIVPADLRLIETSNLIINESVLTGESEPASKSERLCENVTTAIHEATNIAFSATHIISGSGLGVVIATGADAYIGTIAKLTVEMHQVSSFERGMSKFSTFILRIVAITLAIILVANIIIKGGDTNFGDLIIFAIALATAVIPEALPLVITFSLSRGAVRLAKHKVVVKRLSAIEDLGGIQILCTDKTGTITENKLAVVDIFNDKEHVLTHAECAINLQSQHKDPFDIAILEASKDYQSTLKHTKLIHEIPFDPDRKRNSVLVDINDKPILIIRGAAEAVLPHVKSPPETIYTWIKEQEKLGRRVIVIAHKHTKTNKEYTQELEENNLDLTGAISFSDSLKKSTIAAVKKAQKLGVNIKIITGDSATVAGVVAFSIGLTDNSDQVITGEDFFALPHSKQRHIAEKMSVFARFSPHQKHQLVDILEQNFEVGFLGEGINDAPALKSANVGLVVDGASDIARESADVILLNPSLNVIIDGIEEGREVFANTIKYVKMTLASNFGNFYAVAISSLFISYLPMLPIQILLVNLLSDFPSITIATDSVDTEEIKQPESYNLRDFALIATILGFISTIFDFIFFGLFYQISPAVLQTNWFIGSILTELALLYSLRTRQPFYKAKRPPWIIIALTSVAALVTILIPYSDLGTSFFQFTPPTMRDMLTILGIVISYFMITEGVKLAYYRYIADSELRN